MKRILVLCLIAAGIYGVLRLWQSGALELPGAEEEKKPVAPVVFEDVQVRVYGEGGEVQADVMADRVLTDKRVNELSFEPVRAIFYQGGIETARLTADRGQKKVKARKERVDFSGHVRVLSTRPAELRTEHLRYFPKDGMLEAPSRAWVITTSTTIVGDSIRTTTNLKRGVVRGNVEIVSNEGFGMVP